MHGMRSVAQRVENQMVKAAQEILRRLRDRIEIGEISDGADAESIHSDGAVTRGERNYFRAEELECTVDCVEFHLWQRALERWPRENVSDSAAENGERVFGSENRNGRLLL